MASDPVADTDADSVTDVPTRTGLAGLTVNVVLVGLEGGGGNGSVPPVSERENSLTLPEKRVVMVVAASAQCVVVTVTGGIVKLL